MLSTKDTFPALENLSDADPWLRLICVELIARLHEARGGTDGLDGDDVWPKTLVLSYRDGQLQLLVSPELSLPSSPFVSPTLTSHPPHLFLHSRPSHQRNSLQPQVQTNPIPVPLPSFVNRPHPRSLDAPSRRSLRRWNTSNELRPQLHGARAKGGRAEGDRGFSEGSESG